MKYNIWNKWDPLEVCMLGNNYSPEFFNGIPDKAGDPLKRICEETLEDLEGYKNILQDFGVEVIQPEMDNSERFIDNPHKYPRGPLQPRDAQLVLGNDCYISQIDHPSISKKLEEYGPVTYLTRSYLMPQEYYEAIAGADFPNYLDYKSNYRNQDFFEDSIWKEIKTFDRHVPITSASAFMIGTKLIVGHSDHQNPAIDIPQTLKDMKLDLLENVPAVKDFDLSVISTDGHSDGNYHTIKPGAILSLHDVQTYDQTFPGWDVCYLPDQSWNGIGEWTKLRKQNQGKWWLAGEEENNEFTNFVESWLGNWVGYVEETVFDVNVLMLDEHHCCVSNPNNQKVNAFLKKHSIEPVHVPWRHRFFWDGGLHCITLDLKRRGSQQNYFGD